MQEQRKDKPTILLVDDSKIVRVTGRKVLADEFDVLMAEDGAQAWEILNTSHTIRLVLSDLQMPVLDGFGLLEKIRQSDNETINQLPLIILTGADNTDEPKKRAMELGATDFLTKPFDHSHLLARVRAHVGYQQQARSLMEQVNIDSVTGLLNREAFDARLAKDTAFVSRHGHSLAVMLIQLDNHKKLFEAVGRKSYNAVVKKISHLLQQAIRKEDTLARAGLAQFLISLPTAHPASVNEMARRIASAIEACELNVQGKAWQLSLSIGVLTSPAGSSINANNAIQSVHQALEQSLSQKNSHISVLGQQVDSRPLKTSPSLVHKALG